ncbi:DUF1349 domain-containing protein, partial [Klebsiella pneumoniae]
LEYPTGGEQWRLRRRGSSPPGRGKGGVMCCSPERGGRALAFQIIQLPPPLDKALHDLS